MLFFSYWNFYFHFCAIFFIPSSLFLIYYLIFFISPLPFFLLKTLYTIALSYSWNLSLFAFRYLLPYHFLFFLRTTILFSSSYPFIVFCCYSSPALSLVLFSHSPHSHASPSTVFTLPHASSFPFSRFSLHLFGPICCLALWTLSLSLSLSVSLSSSLFLPRPDQPYCLSRSHVYWRSFPVARRHLAVVARRRRGICSQRWFSGDGTGTRNTGNESRFTAGDPTENKISSR